MTQTAAAAPPPPGPTRWLAGAREGWRLVLAYAAVILTPVVAYVGNLGFAPLVALLGAGALVLLGRRSRPSLGLAILLLLLVWALVSMSWSPAMPVQPDFHRYKAVEALTGVKLTLELGLYAAFVMAMRPVRGPAAARASLVLAIGAAALAVLLVVEAADGAALYQIIKAAAHQKTRQDLAMRNVARACYVLTVLFWPLALRLQRARQPLVTLVLAGGLAISAFAFKVDSPMLALVLAALVFGGVLWLGRAVIWVLVAGVVIYFAAAPLAADFVTHRLLGAHDLAGEIGKASWGVRLDIWRFASGEVLQNPLKGWGLDASRAWPNDIPLHPHDAALQLWLELGALGAALGAMFWAWLFTRIAAQVERDPAMAAASAASAVSYLVIGALSFGVWQEWWLAVGAAAVVACGLVAASRRTGDAGGEPAGSPATAQAGEPGERDGTGGLTPLN